MNTKLKKLIKLTLSGDSQISMHTSFSNLMRLADGDLSHIGDALLRGDKIMGEVKHRKYIFSGEAEHYSIKPRTRTVELPTPIKEGELETGDEYWVMDISAKLGYSGYIYDADVVDRRAIKYGLAYRSEDDIKMVLTALGGE